jgi:hypothetical protein
MVVDDPGRRPAHESRSELWVLQQLPLTPKSSPKYTRYDPWRQKDYEITQRFSDQKKTH